MMIGSSLDGLLPVSMVRSDEYDDSKRERRRGLVLRLLLCLACSTICLLVAAAAAIYALHLKRGVVGAV